MFHIRTIHLEQKRQGRPDVPRAAEAAKKPVRERAAARKTEPGRLRAADWMAPVPPALRRRINRWAGPSPARMKPSRPWPANRSLAIYGRITWLAAR